MDAQPIYLIEKVVNRQPSTLESILDSIPVDESKRSKILHRPKFLRNKKATKLKRFLGSTSGSSELLPVISG